MDVKLTCYHCGELIAWIPERAPKWTWGHINGDGISRCNPSKGTMAYPKGGRLCMKTLGDKTSRCQGLRAHDGPCAYIYVGELISRVIYNES